MFNQTSSIADFRLAKALLGALIVHLTLIFGLNFEWSTERIQTPMLEITLALTEAPDKIQTADFIAQMNQQGSGDNEYNQAIFTPMESPYIGQKSEIYIDQQNLQHNPSDAPIIAKNDTADWQTDEMLEREPTDQIDILTEQYLSHDIESLQAHLDSLQNSYAKMPKVTRLTSVSTAYAAEADYLLKWQQQVEKTGNRFYPKRAKALGLEGDVRLMVAISPDGSIKEVRMLASSGHVILDQAARNIVHLAAPFAELPLEIAKNTDILEIIRTWQFRNARLSSRAN